MSKEGTVNDPPYWETTERLLIFDSRNNRPAVKAWLIYQQHPLSGHRQGEFIYRTYYEILPHSGLIFETEYIVHAANSILSNYSLYGIDWPHYMDSLKELVLKLVRLKSPEELLIESDFRIQKK